VSRRDRLIGYPQTRALEDTAYGHDMAPTRVFAVLLPVWSVAFTATVTDGEPYGLIDRFLCRGIDEAGLDTPGELAAFLSLERPLVDKALRTLEETGQLTRTRGRLALTEVGRASVRDGVRHVTRVRTRRRMYVDAYGSRPLPAECQDRGAVAYLSTADAADLPSDGPRFHLLAHHRPLRREALTSLAEDRDRARFGLPRRVTDVAGVSEGLVYLPLYVVRALDGDGAVRYLAYSRAGSEASPELSAICQRTDEIRGVLETEEVDGRAERDETRAREWLRGREIRSGRVARLPGGSWRVTVPAAAFDDTLVITMLGSYVAVGSGFFQVWCTDRRARQRALAERVGAIVGSRPRIDRAEADEVVGRIARQLELGPMDTAGLRKVAARVGRQALADQLGRL
jgi:hypothetical protein